LYIPGEKIVRKPTREPTRRPTRQPVRKPLRRSIRSIEVEAASFARALVRDNGKSAIERISQLFLEAKFEVERELDLGRPGVVDLIVGSTFLGRHRRYAIDVEVVLDAEEVVPLLDRLERYAASHKKSEQFEELWLVTNLSLPRGAGPNYRSSRARWVRAFTFQEVERMLTRLRPKPPRPPKVGKAKTKIGKAVEANEAAINLAISGLILQVDDKLEVLRQERPNSDDAITHRDMRISDYERMRTELENIRAVVAAFTKGRAKEKEVVKSVATFREGIQNWWHKGHEAIINKTFDTGLFLSSVGILTLMNADVKKGMIVSGTLIAGKSIAGGLNGMKKKLFGD
jgi:hypothetical protein